MIDKLNTDKTAVVGRVRELIAEALDIEPDEIHPDANFFEKYGMDSIGIVMVYVDLSMEYGIPEPLQNEDFSKKNTVFKLADYIMEKIT